MGACILHCGHVEVQCRSPALTCHALTMCEPGCGSTQGGVGPLRRRERKPQIKREWQALEDD